MKTDTPETNVYKPIISAFKKVKEDNPLTYCMTNTVTIKDCANAVLAIGGSPIMSTNKEEVEDIIKIAKSLVINMGNPINTEIEAMTLGCKYANNENIPIVFDPVGVGVSKVRNNLCLNLIQNYDLTCIRGNMSEIKAIANLINLDVNTKDNETYGKGVDVNINDLITEKNLIKNSILIKELSKKLNTIIITSGPIDILSNGKETYAINNGDDMMPKITGSGCMLSTIIGSYIGSNNPMIGSITGSLHMALAGEKAGHYTKNNNLGLGSFNQHLIDNLYLLKEEDILKNSRIKKLNI